MQLRFTQHRWTLVCISIHKIRYQSKEGKTDFYRVIFQFPNKEFPIDFSSATSNPQQVQISLDHDYCSSSSKMKRGQRLANNTSHALNHYQQNSNGSPIGSGNNIISTTRPVIRLHQSSNSHSVNQLNCQLQNGGTVSCSASPNTGLVLTKKD